MSPDNATRQLDVVDGFVRTALADWLERPFVLGICGSQGSGKSTLADGLRDRWEARGLKVALLSLDDLYLPKEGRLTLAREHPLFVTRGVPGTHDIALGESVFAALGEAGVVRIPRFAKEHDTRKGTEEWETLDAPVDIVLFEGWCVGAAPEKPEALSEPVNALEREEDAQRVWRAAVNARLAGDYQRLFDRIDRLVLLAAPDFDIVSSWRKEQEHQLRTQLAAEGRDAAGALDDAAIDRFVQHYQRLTRHILDEMPARADLTIWLDRNRRVIRYRERKDR